MLKQNCSNVILSGSLGILGKIRKNTVGLRIGVSNWLLWGAGCVSLLEESLLPVGHVLRPTIISGVIF